MTQKETGPGKGPSRSAENASPESMAPAAQIASLTILQCQPGRVLTKRYAADGTKQDFSAGYHMRIEETPAATWPELLAALEFLVGCPDMCVVRGAAVADCPRSGDPDEWVYRRSKSRPGEPANFVSVARHWVVYDFDDTAAPFSPADPETSIRAWHSTLPSELRAACSAFFPSSSAHVSPNVRGKLVVWYRAPISEARARLLAVHYHADPSVAGAVQPNYFAAPIFDDCVDPLAGHRTPIVFEGRPATQPTAAALKATRNRPPPAAVRLGCVPPGDAGILAALGPHEDLRGYRFNLLGKLGGLMRRLGFSREDCAAVVRDWVPEHEWEPGLSWAVGAWDKPPIEVSGVGGLAELVGTPHAHAIFDAVCAARRPTRWTAGGVR